MERGIILMDYLGNMREGPGSPKHKHLVSQTVRACKLGTVRALGKLTIDEYISVSQPCCWGEETQD